MNYALGFPVDGGETSRSFIVKVAVKIAEKHYCEGGRASGLRPNSGGEFVFERAPLYIQNRYRFVFSPTPMPNATIRPDTIASCGYSDALACALAVEQTLCHQEQVREPLLLFSCSFMWSEKNKGLNHCALERVANDREWESLQRKWQVAKTENAKALFLHSEDAKLLQQHQDVPIIALAKLDREKLKKIPTTMVISCGRDEYHLLRSLLFAKKLRKTQIAVVAAISVILCLCYLYTQFYKDDVTATPQQELQDVSVTIANKQELIACLDSDKSSVYIMAVRAIKSYDQELLPLVLSGVKRHPRQQSAVIRHLKSLRVPATDVLPYLNKNHFLRKVAINILRNNYMHIETQKLREYLQNQDTREIALEFISKNDNRDLDIYKDLLQLLNSNKTIRHLAARCICSFVIDTRSLLYEAMANNELPQQILLEIAQVVSLQNPVNIAKIDIHTLEQAEIFARIVVQQQQTQELLQHILSSRNLKKMHWALDWIRVGANDEYLISHIVKCLQQPHIQKHNISKRLLQMLVDINITTEQVAQLVRTLLKKELHVREVVQVITQLKISNMEDIIIPRLRQIDRYWPIFVQASADLQLQESLAQLEPFSTHDSIAVKIPATVALIRLGKESLLSGLLQDMPKYSLSWQRYITEQMATFRVSKEHQQLIKNLHANATGDLQALTALWLFAIDKDLHYLPLALKCNAQNKYKIIGDWRGEHIRSYLQLLSQQTNADLYLQYFYNGSLPQKQEVHYLQKWLYHPQEPIRTFILDKLFEYQQSTLIVSYLNKVALDRKISIEQCLYYHYDLKLDDRECLRKIMNNHFYWKYRALAQKILFLRK